MNETTNVIQVMIWYYLLALIWSCRMVQSFVIYPPFSPKWSPNSRPQLPQAFASPLDSDKYAASEKSSIKEERVHEQPSSTRITKDMRHTTCIEKRQIGEPSVHKHYTPDSTHTRRDNPNDNASPSTISTTPQQSKEVQVESQDTINNKHPSSNDLVRNNNIDMEYDNQHRQKRDESFAADALDPSSSDELLSDRDHPSSTRRPPSTSETMEWANSQSNIDDPRTLGISPSDQRTYRVPIKKSSRTPNQRQQTHPVSYDHHQMGSDDGNNEYDAPVLSSPRYRSSSTSQEFNNNNNNNHAIPNTRPPPAAAVTTRPSRRKPQRHSMRDDDEMEEYYYHRNSIEAESQRPTPTSRPRPSSSSFSSLAPPQNRMDPTLYYDHDEYLSNNEYYDNDPTPARRYYSQPHQQLKSSLTNFMESSNWLFDTISSWLGVGQHHQPKQEHEQPYSQSHKRRHHDDYYSRDYQEEEYNRRPERRSRNFNSNDYEDFDNEDDFDKDDEDYYNYHYYPVPKTKQQEPPPQQQQQLQQQQQQLQQQQQQRRRQQQQQQQFLSSRQLPPLQKRQPPTQQPPTQQQQQQQRQQRIEPPNKEPNDETTGWNILDDMVGIDNTEMTKNAARYNAQLVRSTDDRHHSPKVDPNYNHRNYHAMYNENMDDAMYDNDDTRAVSKIRREKERIMALERVPPAGIVAFGPTGVLNMDARQKAIEDALQDLETLQRKVNDQKQKEERIKKDLIVLKENANQYEKQWNRLQQQESAYYYVDNDDDDDDDRTMDNRKMPKELIHQRLVQINDKIYRVGLALRKARAQVELAKEEYEAMYEKHWAVLSFYNPPELAEENMEEKSETTTSNGMDSSGTKESISGDSVTTTKEDESTTIDPNALTMETTAPTIVDERGEKVLQGDSERLNNEKRQLEQQQTESDRESVE